jgi:hypothetical protein
MKELGQEKIPRNCPRTYQDKKSTRMIKKPTTHLVAVAREGVPEVTEFSSYEDAVRYFEMASLNWTESYLSVVVAGPDKPLKRVSDPYCTPDVIALRSQPLVSVCIDDDCDLSGGYAHVGPCEPCACPLKHAIEECPHYRAQKSV